MRGRPFADGATDVVLTVAAPADLQPEWRGLVVDAADRPIAGAVVRTKLWSPLGGLGSTVLLANSFVAGADGRVVVPGQCGDGVTVTVEAPGCVTMTLARRELHGPALRLGRVAYLRWLGRKAPESVNQLRLELHDADDRPLAIEGPYMGSWYSSSTFYLTGARSGVLAVSELATTLVVYSDDGAEHRDEPHRYPIRLTAGEVTTID
jgi:hypothetical protein